jgi:hypothetical protein
MIYVNEIFVTDISYNSLADTLYTYSFSSTADQTGTVKVYLLTTDTNPSVPGGSTFLLKAGDTSSTPYIANYFELNAVDYQVYNEPVGSQNIILDWNSQAIGGWSLLTDYNYRVYYQVNDTLPNAWTPYNRTINTTITFDASANVCGDQINFYVEASLTKSGVTYVAKSNVQSINFFKYASPPEALEVLWSSANNTNTVMDIRFSFKNPLDIGCGEVVNFIVEVLDSSNNPITPSTRVDYVNGVNPYTVNFNDLTYSLNGNIIVRMIKKDTNSPGEDRYGNPGSVYFSTDSIPILLEDEIVLEPDRTLLTFEAITQANLESTFGIITVTPEGVILFTALPLTTTVTGVTIVLTPLDNGENKYTITVDPEALDLSQFPLLSAIVISNASGVQQFQF